ncbi:hypothetical protein V8D89_004235 [Ganoderma adspersum]
MADLRCKGCKVTFNNQKSKNQHISASPDCLDLYENLSTHQAAVVPPPPIGPPHPAPLGLPHLDSPLHWPSMNYDQPSSSPVESAEENIQKRRRVMVEQVENESANENTWTHKRYPGEVETSLGEGITVFSDILEEQKSMQEQLYALFKDHKEWGLVKWLMRQTNQSGADEYLKLEITRTVMKPGFKNKVAMLRKVNALLVGPQWHYDIVNVTSDREGPRGEALTEELDLWRRDPAECILDLIGNPAFKDVLVYEPVHIKRDGQRYYSEMNTGDWWWNIQKHLPKGATVAAVILASDKANSSVLRGDKTAWPIYLTIANIDKDVCRKPSKHTSVLLGYIPVVKLTCFKDATRSDAQQQLFHACMKALLTPLIEAGRHGVPMTCADSLIWHVYPILAAYVADHPEQCLITCYKENRYPWCVVPQDERGSETPYPLHNQRISLDIMKNAQDNIPNLEEHGLRPLPEPFWAELLHTDIFATISPDILHQHHKGVFKDNLVEWISELIGKMELDGQFASLSHSHGLRHFKNEGEAKEIEKVLLGLLIGRVDPDVVTAVKALIDFIYLVQHHVHSDMTLRRMRDALRDFHHRKHIFIELGIRENFNIPKLHALLHYLKAISSLGCLDGLNTEASERLHIDYYTVQMTTYLSWVLRGEEGVDSGTDSTDEGAASEEDMAEDDGEDKEEDREEEPDAEEANFKTLKSLLNSNVCPAYHIPLFPSDRRISIPELGTCYGAASFLAALNTFLDSHLPTVTHPNDFNTYNVFHYINILKPAMRHFDNSKHICKAKHKSEGGLNGLCAAQPRSGLYTTSHSTSNKARRHSIVSAATFICLCHLIPKYGGNDVDPEWTPDTILDEYIEFFLNTYVNFHMFHDITFPAGV